MTSHSGSEKEMREWKIPVSDLKAECCSRSLEDDLIGNTIKKLKQKNWINETFGFEKICHASTNKQLKDLSSQDLKIPK